MYAHMLRTQPSTSMSVDYATLYEHGRAPQGSVGCHWTPDLFDDERWHLAALYENGRLRTV